MKNMLFKAALFLGSSALGILAARLLVRGFDFSIVGFVVVVVVFSVAQMILSPLVEQMIQKYAAALMGGVGIISTFVALFVANLIAGSLTIKGVSGWIFATLVIWLVTALATWFLPSPLQKAFKMGDTPGGANS